MKVNTAEKRRVESGSGFWRLAARIVLAGPVAAGLTLLVLAGMPLWLPKGASGVDNLIWPLVILPGIWALLFFHAILDRSLLRIALVALLLGGLNTIMLTRHLSAGASHHSSSGERAR
jgi:hypothetical protein